MARLRSLQKYIPTTKKRKRPSRADPEVKKKRALAKKRKTAATRKAKRIVRVSILKDSNVEGVAGKPPRYASSRKSDARRYYREFLAKFGVEDLSKKRRRMVIRLIALEEVLEGEGRGMFAPEVRASLMALV